MLNTATGFDETSILLCRAFLEASRHPPNHPRVVDRSILRNLPYNNHVTIDKSEIGIIVNTVHGQLWPSRVCLFATVGKIEH